MRLCVCICLQPDFVMTVCLYLFTAWPCDDCVSVSVYSLTLWWLCVCICLQPDLVMTVCLYQFTAWPCDDSLTLWWLCVCICLQPDFVTSMFELSSGFTMLSLNDTEVGLFTGIILATNGKLLCLPPSWFRVKKNRCITKQNIWVGCYVRPVSAALTCRS